MKIELIAHRGFSAIAPENTLAAFSAAVENGFDAIEFDVQLCADRLPVIIHDPAVDRTSNGSGLVREQTLAQLKTLDAGSWFDVRFGRETIPTFAEALDLLKHTNLKIYAEVKETNFWSEKDINNLLDLILDRNYENRCIVASFDPHFLQKVRDCQQNLTLKLGYHVAKLAEFKEKLSYAALDRSLLLCEYHLLLDNPSSIQTIRNRGLDIIAWTVDLPEELEKLAKFGVKGIISNKLVHKN